MFGAGLGFLWFNTFPATIFMGDVGSLSIGGSLGLIACMVKQEHTACNCWRLICCRSIICNITGRIF